MSDTNLPAPEHLSDDELTAELRRLAAAERNATVALLSHLAEFDRRRLYRGAGFSSLFGYCTGALRFSESSAYHRIKAARAARKFPVILELLGNGVANLTSIRLLAPHLTPENHKALLDEAAGKSRLQVEELLARRFPQPPVADGIRKLPPPAIAAAAAPTPAPIGTAAPVLGERSPERVTDPETGNPTQTIPATVAPLSALAPATHRSVIAPLSSDQYKVTFTATTATWRKLQQAQELLRHQVPHGDLAEVIDRALGALLEQLTRRKFAAVTHPPSTEAGASGESSAASGRHIPAQVRRAVWMRDGGRCGFVGRDGRRCSDRSFVEFHHLRPFAVGGPPTTENIALRCRSHNGYEAEVYFGPSRRLATAQPP
jgi:hypothetical protein